MLIQTPYFTKINAILWHPAYSCGTGCKGCYVAEGSINKYNPTQEVIDNNIDLVSDLIFNQRKLRADQLTIAVDKLGRRAITNTLLNLNKIPETKVHLTVKSAKYWIEQIKVPLSGVSLLSISFKVNSPDKVALQIKDINRLRTNSHSPSIGLNIIVSEDTMTYTGMEVLSKLIDNGYKTEAEQIYFIVKKSLLHKYMCGRDTEDFFKLLYQNQKHIKRMRDSGINLYLDHCIKVPYDNIKYGRNNLCSAGVDRLSIWPNLHISGCPYDTNCFYQGFQKLKLMEKVDKALHFYPALQSPGCYTFTNAIKYIRDNWKDLGFMEDLFGE